MKIKVYHGATLVIKHPDVSRGRDNLDFGKAFYVTRLREQAESWAEIVFSRYEEGAPVVNVYSLDLDAVRDEGYKYLNFPDYDEAWLNFIVGSRMGRKPWMGFDLIEGGVANDRVIDTVEGYMDGDFSVDVAIGRLKHYKPNNQIAILNQEIVERHFTWEDAVYLDRK